MGFFTGLFLFPHLFGSCFEASGSRKHFQTNFFYCGLVSDLNADQKKKKKEATNNPQTHNFANFPRDIGFILTEIVLMLYFCFLFSKATSPVSLPFESESLWEQLIPSPDF